MLLRTRARSSMATTQLWTGRHTNITDREGKLWSAERCQNPEAELECHPAKTFRDFVELGKKQ